MKSIIVNVDDLGMSPAVNEAVLRLAGQGRIQATSFMSLGQLDGGAADALRRLGVEIGWHVDLTGMAAQGSLRQVLQRSYLRRWSLPQLRDLLRRQLDAFEDQIGAAPVFVDGHQHVHQFPQVRALLLELVLGRYGHQVAWRQTRALPGSGFKAGVIHALGGGALLRQLRQHRLPHNPWFGGVYDFQPDAQALAGHWQRWLAAAPQRQTTLLMCHPACPDDGWSDEIRVAREQEWRWLSSDAFAELWQAGDCQAGSWRQLIAAETAEKAATAAAVD